MEETRKNMINPTRKTKSDTIVREKAAHILIILIGKRRKTMTTTNTNTLNKVKQVLKTSPKIL